MVQHSGGSIYVHAFGAYFGLAVSVALKHRSSNSSSSRNNSNNSASHTSDVLATVGAFLLWVFWPAFNAALALDSNSRARSVVNTHISLAAATAATFALSAFMGRSAVARRTIWAHLDYVTKPCNKSLPNTSPRATPSLDPPLQILYSILLNGALW